MPKEHQFPADLAQGVADRTIDELEGLYERMQTAGSLLRGRAMVGDLELLYVPRWDDRTTTKQNPAADLFGGEPTIEEHARVDLVDEWIRADLERGELATFEKRLKPDGRPIGVGPKNKYLVHRATGLPVDIFTADARNWGMALFVRTGPAEWNIAAMSAFQRLGMRAHAYGGIYCPGRGMIECPTEEVVFEELGLPWIPPDRRDPYILRGLTR